MMPLAGRGWRGPILLCALVTAVVTLHSSCMPSATVTCDDGTICSADTTCRVVGPDTLCVSPQQEKDCLGKAEGEVCGENTGMANRCRGGLCLPSPCGDTVIDPSRGEVCEAANVSQLQSCEQRGYQGGEVGCSASCGGADTAGCSGYCGDGVVDADEECDGVAFAEGLPSKCSDFEGGVLLGTVSCSSQCRIDSRSCQDSPWTTGSIITVPAFSAEDGGLAASVVDTNEVWVVVGNPTRSMGSGVAWWNGDRWQRARLDGEWNYRATSCGSIWATRGHAWVGCSDGAVIEIDELGEGRSALLGSATANGSVDAIWGRSQTDIWASRGSEVFHYDGIAWSSAGAPGTMDSIVAIGGGRAQVFALTTNALFTLQGTVWKQVANGPLGPYRFMSVIQDDQIWLASSTQASFFDGVALSSQVVDIDYPVSFIGLSADVFYYTVVPEPPAVVPPGKNLHRRQLDYSSPSKPFRDSIEEVALVRVLAAGPGGELWAMRSSGRFAVRTQQLDAVELAPPPGPDTVVTVSNTDILFFNGPVNDALRSPIFSHDPRVFRGVATSIWSVDGSVLDLAAVAGPNGEQLLVQGPDLLHVCKPGTCTITLLTPRSMWSDGTDAFVVSTQGLHRFVNATTWPMLPVTIAATASAPLLTGGRINQDFTLWLVPPRLDANTAVPTKIQRIEISSSMPIVTTEISIPIQAGRIDVSAIWSSGPDLWVAGWRAPTNVFEQAYVAHWSNGRWLDLSPPVGLGEGMIAKVIKVWSNRPGQLWAIGQALSSSASQLLRFDGSRWYLASAAAVKNLTTLSRNTGRDLWTNSSEGPRVTTLARVDNTIQNLTGGRCPAQQELICVENGHSSTAPERNIATIVGGRFGSSHYVLNSPILGTLRLTAGLPAGVEAVWGLANTVGACSPGAALTYVAPASTPANPNPVPQAEVTLGRARYFLTLRTVDPLDTTEYPLSIDYSCNRSD